MKAISMSAALAAACVSCTLVSSVLAGPYSPQVGDAGANAINASDPRISGWATGAAELVRGPQQIDDPASPPADFGVAANAFGPADATPNDGTPVVSLGDGGHMTLTFAEPIGNVPGPDFALFENALVFSGLSFLELAYVEVSSDGSTFARFPAVSLTTTPVGAFDPIDPTDLNNLAGKHLAGWGTPFELDEITSAAVDTNAITHVRLVDVVGTDLSAFATADALGNTVLDPYPTRFGSGGFDVDAVAVLNAVPEPTAIAAIAFAGLLMRRR